MQLNNKYFQSRSQSPRILGQRLSNAQNPGQNEESEPEILLPVYGARAFKFNNRFRTRRRQKFLEATLLLISTKNRPLELVQHRKSAIHGLSVKSEKSDWLKNAKRKLDVCSENRVWRSRFLVLIEKSAASGDVNVFKHV